MYEELKKIERKTKGFKMKEYSIENLQAIARTLRRDTIRAIYLAGDGHPGPSLSAADIITALYFGVMNIDPHNPKKQDRDRFILSKGHACPMLYAALAHAGYFSKDELPGLRSLHSMLQGHPDMQKTPGIDSTSGSLGNGLSIGLGMAISAKLQKQHWRTFVLLGDGELAEGVVWEAALVAGHHKTANLTAIIDNNGMQSGGSVEDVTGIAPLADKFKSFGWHVIEIDGHDIQQILDGCNEAKEQTDRPTVLIAKTVKGRGVSYMIGDNSWHKRVFTQKEYEQAMQELGGKA